MLSGNVLREPFRRSFQVLGELSEIRKLANDSKIWTKNLYAKRLKNIGD
jgi:hypothetical protein